MPICNNTLCNTAVERCSGSAEQPANNPGYNGGDWAADASPHEQATQTTADSTEQPTKNAAYHDVEGPGNYSANAEIALSTHTFIDSPWASLHSECLHGQVWMWMPAVAPN